MAKKKQAPLSAKQKLSREALQWTWVIKGQLKSEKLQTLRIGRMLANVRDRKYYDVLHHPDMEDYAAKRLNLSRASLYKYLMVYDWVAMYHKDWLEKTPKGPMPDFNDIADLVWIEKELQRKDLNPKRKAGLEELRQKALEGKLRKGELAPFRRRTQTSAKSGLKAFLSKLRNLRKRGAEMKNMPPEAITGLDAVIEIIKNDHALQVAGFNILDSYGEKWRGVA